MADVAINADAADIPSVNFAQQSGDVAAPAAGRWQLFFKSTGLWVITNGASAFRLAKHVMTAAGDLTVGGAAGVETRLAMGAALQHLRVNAGGTALEWADPPAGGYTQGCRIRNAGDQSINSSQLTVLSFDTEDFDTDGMHEGVTHPDRIAIQTTGKYIVGFQVAWAATASQTRRLHSVQANASTVLLNIDANHTQTGGEYFEVCGQTLVSLTAGDYLTITVFQASGAPLAVKGLADHTPIFYAERVG